MSTPAAHHRLDARGTREQSRAFHLSRIFGAVRALRLLLDVLSHSRSRSVEESAARLSAKHALELALPYLSDEEGRVRL